MSGPDRLPLAQKALNVLIDQLRPQDRVSIVAYAGSAGAVLLARRRPLEAEDALRAGGLALGRLDRRRPGAWRWPTTWPSRTSTPRRSTGVILLTDGDFNVGIADPAA